MASAGVGRKPARSDDPAENPRAERSRTSLIDAMTRTLDEHGGASVLSVAEIARSAGVSRPTLYQHFGDLQNLVRASAMVRLVALFESVPPPAVDARIQWRDASAVVLGALLTELEARRGFYLAVLDSSAGGDVREDIIAFLAARIIDVTALGPLMRDAEPTDEDAHERAMFLSAGALWRTERWLRDESSEPAAVFASRLSRLLGTAAGVPSD